MRFDPPSDIYEWVYTPNPCDSYNATNSCDISYLDGYAIKSPELLPSCLLAGFIGYYGYKGLFAQKNAIGHLSYAITFAMLGVMMPDAGFNDCILAEHGNQKDFIHLFFGVLDVGLTSCIGLSFTFNALVDWRIIDEESRKTKMCMFFSYLTIFIAWLFTFLYDWQNGFMILYVFLILTSCTFYVGAEIALIVHTANTTGLKWVLWGAITGGFGLAGIAVPPLQKWLCVTFGCHFAGEFWWFVLTDVSMWCIYKYLVTRSQSPAYQKDGYLPLSLAMN